MITVLRPDPEDLRKLESAVHNLASDYLSLLETLRALNDSLENSLKQLDTIRERLQELP